MKIIINLGREIRLVGSARESIMTPSETSSEKNDFSIRYEYDLILLNSIFSLMVFVIFVGSLLKNCMQK
jgi:hypothetical protein